MVLGFHTTALFNLDKLYGKKINIYSIQHSLDAIKIDFLIDRFKRISQEC